jgi:hypothetical protein
MQIHERECRLRPLLAAIRGKRRVVTPGVKARSKRNNQPLREKLRIAHFPKNKKRGYKSSGAFWYGFSRGDTEQMNAMSRSCIDGGVMSQIMPYLLIVKTDVAYVGSATH